MGDATDPRLTHWGEAAALFSLDLAMPVSRVLFGAAVDPARLRDAMRHAILENRENHAAGHGPLFLRDVLEWLAADDAWFTPVADFIDLRMVTASRPENLVVWQAHLLGTDASDREIRDALPPEWADGGLRAKIIAALPPAEYDALFTAAIATDAAIAGGRLSEWDAAMMQRNPQICPAADPIRTLIYSADLSLRARALPGDPPAQPDPAAVAEAPPGEVMPFDPASELARRRIALLTRRVIAQNGAFYADAPPGFVALQLHEFLHFGEAAGIDDPDLADQILLAAFAPAPLALGGRDAAYLTHLVGSSGASAPSRTRAVLDFIGKRNG